MCHAFLARPMWDYKTLLPYSHLLVLHVDKEKKQIKRNAKKLQPRTSQINGSNISRLSR